MSDIVDAQTGEVTEAPGVQMLRKITVKDVMEGTGVEYKKPMPGHPVELFTVFGTARDMETVTTTYGDSQRWKGDFEAVRSCDGKRFVGPELFLDGFTSSLLLNQYGAAKKEHGDDAAVNFAFRLGAQAHIRGAGESMEHKHKYTVEPIQVTEQVSDPLAALRAKVGAVVPQVARTIQHALPAPEAARKGKQTA